MPLRPPGDSTNAAASTAFVQQNALTAISVVAYGADPTGTNDSTTAIQNAINALPASGGKVVLPVGTYKISSTLTMGNGTASTGSTTQGIVLEGLNNPTTPFTLGAFTTTSGVKINWNGGAADMLQVLGPLQGWGVKNIYFNCAGSTAATTGLHVRSAQFGDSANLTFNGCVHGLISDTVAVFGSFTNTDSLFNKYLGVYVTVPNTTGATGITLTGTTTSNTDYNQFFGVSIAFAGNCTNCVGLYMAAVDNDKFYQLQFPGASGSNVQCVVYDYTVNNVWPASTAIYGIDTGSTGAGCITPYGVAGTPGSGATPNYLIEIDETNGGAAPTNIKNLAVYGSHNIVMNAGGNAVGTDLMGAWTTYSPSPSCGTATFGTISASSKTMGKTTWIRADFTFTAAGTCTATGPSTPLLAFNLPNTAQSSSALSGQEVVNSAKGISCSIGAGSTATFSCRKSDGSAFATNDRVLVSGVYENQ